MRLFIKQDVTVFGKCVVISGNELIHLFTELRRCLSGFLFKDSCKVGFFVVSEFKANLRDSFVRRYQKIFSFNEFSGLNNFRYALL